MIKYVNGDLFDHLSEEPTIIAHIVNSKGAWGAGFVIPLAKRFPVARQAYIAWSSNTEVPSEVKWNPPFKLGQTQVVQATENIMVANMLAQTLGGARPLFYNHLACAMDELLIRVPFPNFQIICPMFGSGLAGGDWNFVEKLIEDCWVRCGMEVTVCYLPQFLPNNWNPPADTLHEDTL